MLFSKKYALSFLLGGSVLLTGCGGSTSDGSISDGQDTSNSGGDTNKSIFEASDASAKMTSGYRAVCFNSAENGLSMRDVYQFRSDGEVAHQMQVFNGLDCPSSKLTSINNVFGEQLKLKYQVLLEGQNSQGLNTRILRLDVKMKYGDIYVNSGSDPIFIRTYEDGQRMCFGEHEGHYRESDINLLPDVAGYNKTGLATLYGAMDYSEVSEKIQLSIYDHCLEKF